MVIEFISFHLTMAALKGMTGALAPFSFLVIIMSGHREILHHSLWLCQWGGKKSFMPFRPGRRWPA